MKRRSPKCKTCGDAGRVLLPMPETLIPFYGEEVAALIRSGATVKTWFRCEDCA